MNVKLKALQKLIFDNSSTIATSLSVIGVVATAVLTYKTTRKVAHILSDHEGDWKEQVRHTWRAYIPPALVGSSTIAMIICANRISSKRAAALATAYAISEQAFSQYKDKVVEKLGEKSHISVRDSVAQDQVHANPPKTILYSNGGDVLCYDSMMDRYFESNMEDLRKAQNDFNQRLLNDLYGSLGDFYEMIGLKSTPISEEIGWTAEDLMEIDFTTALTDEGRPCMVLGFRTIPIRNYNRLH